MPAFSVKPLSESRIPDFLTFFDKVGFSDNPAWASCYCRYYHFTGKKEEWEASTGKDNRKAVVELIRNGVMRGYLAYYEGAAAGWCNVNLKSAYPLFRHFPDYLTPEDGEAASIVCFVVDPALRRRGVARSLLNRILEDFTSPEINRFPAAFVEAYPRKGEGSQAAHYHGHIAMYEKAGFSIYRELDDFHIVRKKVAAR